MAWSAYHCVYGHFLFVCFVSQCIHWAIPTSAKFLFRNRFMVTYSVHTIIWTYVHTDKQASICFHYCKNNIISNYLNNCIIILYLGPNSYLKPTLKALVIGYWSEDKKLNKLACSHDNVFIFSSDDDKGHSDLRKRLLEQSPLKDRQCLTAPQKQVLF